jgi:hypothetical protein
VNKAPKDTYRISNHPEYNTALIKRGDPFLHFPPEVLEAWYTPQQTQRRPGRPQSYSDTAILAILSLRSYLQLPLRAVYGFVRSLFDRAKIALKVPSYPTLCIRMRQLGIDLEHSQEAEPVHIAIDSSGFKTSGDGEWKARKHGPSKRRTWRKGHIAVKAAGPHKGEIVVMIGTANDVHDCEVSDELLHRVPEKIARVSGDGAYDTRWDYRTIETLGARALIPPRKNAQPWAETFPGATQRNAVLERIAEIGPEKWKEESGYHERSLVENAFFRIKTIFGDHLASRLDSVRDIELQIRTRVLNVFTRLGMPKSYPVRRDTG